jgi:UDP-N-acetyl-D-mannosaminuronic acid dehydrogenase
VNISVIGGCGHVGLPLSLYLSHFGHSVVAFDISTQNVKKVQSKIMPFIETGFQDILSEVIENGNFKATTDMDKISESEVLIVVIGTEVDEHMNPQPNKILEVMKNL